MTVLAIVSTLLPNDREETARFLLRLQAPVILEAVSGLREDPRLQHLRVNYPPEGVESLLRIGGVPTAKIWRDLEVHPLPALSISHLPFPGAQNSGLIVGSPGKILQKLHPRAQGWKGGAQEIPCFAPGSEAALIHKLSLAIPDGSHVYLGNSLPIRTWDLAATLKPKNFDIQASRGLNGIDGQIATFLGLCRPDRVNVAILGDLTTLYDMSAFWILRQMKEFAVTVVIINNGGGMIFAGKFQEPAFQCRHSLRFAPLANMWGMEYFEDIPSTWPGDGHRLIEIII